MLPHVNPLGESASQSCEFFRRGPLAGCVQSNDYESIQSVNYSLTTQTTLPGIARFSFQSAGGVPSAPHLIKPYPKAASIMYLHNGVNGLQ